MGNPIALVLAGRRTTCADTDPLQAAVTRLGRRARVVGVVVLELDHGAGDEALLRAAAALYGTVRTKDTVAHAGSGRFVALLPGCAAGHVTQVARRMQEAVASIDGSGGSSMSVGVAHGTGLDLAYVLRSADEDLCRNKRRQVGPPSPV
ncbi:MAG: Cellulose synthesis regulatory protein [Actinomycetia bacterium]|nr:Cellulose synthesis regulatory protein [Actinomycetes bacterium]